MSRKEPETVGELLFWSYANLAMAHAAVVKGERKYSRIHFMIRARLYRGLCEGSMGLGSIVDDERLKMILPQICSYCGGSDSLAADHLISKSRGGPDTGDNILWACRSCNSSKGPSDVLDWFHSRDEFPPIFLLRRYLKLAIDWAAQNYLLTLPLSQVEEKHFPFRISAIPTHYPSPSVLRLWVQAPGNTL